MRISPSHLSERLDLCVSRPSRALLFASPQPSKRGLVFDGSPTEESDNNAGDCQMAYLSYFSLCTPSSPTLLDLLTNEHVSLTIIKYGQRFGVVGINIEYGTKAQANSPSTNNFNKFPVLAPERSHSVGRRA